MSKERLPEGSGWKERLLELDALHEWKIADKEAVWDRLHQRLGNRRRLMGAAWYRIAAAVLFLFMTGITVFRWERLAGLKNGSVTVKAFPPRPMTPALSRGGYASSQAQPPVFSASAMKTVQRVPGPTGRAIRRGRRSPVYRLEMALLQGAPDSVRSPVLYFMPDPPRVVATNGIGSPAPVAAKPMRIVSINELDHPSGPGSSMAGGSVPDRFRLRWNNHGSSDPAVYSEEQTAPDRSPTNTLIKINLSPQN